MPRFRSDDPWRVLWRMVTSDYLLGLVCLVVALALLLAAWLPQMASDGVTFDATWHAEVQSRFGEDAWFDASRTLLQSVGAFDVAEAAWFRLALALLALVLLVRFIERAESFWLGWQREPPPEDAAWLKVEGGTLEGVMQRLRQRRFRLVVDLETKDSEADAPAPVRVDRWPWGDLGPLVVYFGGLLVLVGAVLTALWGWQTASLLLTAGERVPLERGSDLVLHLESLTQDGRRGLGEIRREVGAPLSAGELAVGAPLSGGGIGAYLVGSGSALQVQATSTRTLELAEGPGRETQEKLVLTFTEEDPRRLVGVPQAGLVLLLAMSQSQAGDAGLQVQAFESGSGQLVLSMDAFTDTSLEVGDVSFALEPVPYADVRVIRDPGAFWSQLGLVFLVTGGLLWMAWPPQRLWLRHSGGEQDADASDGIEVTGDKGGLLLTLTCPPWQTSAPWHCPPGQVRTFPGKRPPGLSLANVRQDFGGGPLAPARSAGECQGQPSLRRASSGMVWGRVFKAAFVGLTMTVLAIVGINWRVWGTPFGTASVGLALSAAWLIGVTCLALRRRFARGSAILALLNAALLVLIASSVHWHLPFD